MAQITNVVIGIQARTGSERYPNKVLQSIGDKAILDHVIEACVWSCRYNNRYREKQKMMMRTCLVVPKGDELVDLYRKKMPVIQGPENDVLSRYMQLLKSMDADYVVRITGDCPLLYASLITKHVKTAVMNEHDYTTNVIDQCRTALDGLDVEVLSKKALQWLDENATGEDREHVTSLLRRDLPTNEFNFGAIIGHVDLSGFKYSVDTIEEHDRVGKNMENVEVKISNAEKLGIKTHRF